jgi:hypothetical protein
MQCASCALAAASPEAMHVDADIQVASGRTPLRSGAVFPRDPRVRVVGRIHVAWRVHHAHDVITAAKLRGVAREEVRPFDPEGRGDAYGGRIADGLIRRSVCVELAAQQLVAERGVVEEWLCEE